MGSACGTYCLRRSGTSGNGVMRLIVDQIWPRGGVATGLQRNFTTKQKESLNAAEAAGVFAYKTVGQGAVTSLVAAVALGFAHTGGHYLDDGQEAYTVADDADLRPTPARRQAMGTRPCCSETSLDGIGRPPSPLIATTRAARDRPTPEAS